MEKKYIETPYNFTEIKKFIITDVDQVTIEIIKANICFFYDTCAFRKHMLIKNKISLTDYIKFKSGIVVITRCILMELCSGDNNLWQEHIDYIKYLYECGIKVVVIFEEDVLVVLKACYSESNEIFNEYLKYAVRASKNPAGTVAEVLKANKVLCKQVIGNKRINKADLYKTFFEEVRSNKRSGDSLGEELICICLHLLCNIREFEECKYIVFTEDKGAVDGIIKTANNLKEHIGKRGCTALTTPKLVYLLYEHNFSREKTDLENIINPEGSKDMMVVLCSEEYDLKPKFQRVKPYDLIEKISNEEYFVIHY